MNSLGIPRCVYTCARVPGCPPYGPIGLIVRPRPQNEARKKVRPKNHAYKEKRWYVCDKSFLNDIIMISLAFARNEHRRCLSLVARASEGQSIGNTPEFTINYHYYLFMLY